MTEEAEQVLEALEFEPTCMILVKNGVRVFRRIVLWGRVSSACGDPARYLARCLNCRQTALCCEDHRVEILGSAAVTCARCDREDVGAELYEFVLIGGVS